MAISYKSLRARWRSKHLRRSLSADLTLGMLIILLLIEGTFLYVIYQRESSAMLEEIEMKAEDYAGKLGEVLAVPIWDFDDEQIEKIGEGFLQNELVSRLRITNNQGGQLFSLDNRTAAGPLVRRAADIHYNEQLIGHVEIALSTSAYDRELIRLRNILLVVLICSALVFYIASGLLLRIFLRKPLQVLARGMDRIAQGDFAHNAQDLSYTELTGIAQRFGEMATRIKDREQTLVQMNRQLQDVNERLRRRTRYEQMLAEVSARAATPMELARFAEESLSLIGEAFAPCWIALYRQSSEEGALERFSHWPENEAALGPARLVAEKDALAGTIFAGLRDDRTTRFDLSDRNAGGGPFQTDFAAALSSLTAVPLFVDGSFYGGVLFGEPSARLDTDDIQPLLETAVRIIVRFIESTRAREMLLRSEERFREMAEMLPETIFEMDLAGILSYVNRNGLHQFGYTSEDLRRGLCAYDMFEETERPRLQRNIRALADGDATRLKEYRALHKEGRSFPTMVSSSAIRKAGRIVGVRGFVIDVSEKKDLEERLRKANRMEAIGNLAAGVAHDLNNILSGLIGYPDLLLLDLPAESPMRPPVEAIKSTGQKAAAVVQDLLTLARRNISQLQIVNVNDIVSDYLDAPEFQQLKQYHANIQVTRELARDVMNVRASAHHLSKGLMNLVSNAMEAMPAGGLLQIQTANRYVDKALAGYETIPEGEYTLLSVIDSGIGISREDMRNIFEPFYTKKRMGRSGTGLGMSVVWAMIKDHGGFVDVESEEGRGARFDIYFPATREKLAPKPSRTPIEDYLGSERILVVDDVAEQRQIAADMLGRLGYAVQTVSSGEAAVEWLRHHTADLLILDMIMDPGIDGLETYHRVLSLVPEQKAVIASGFAETERVTAALELGVREYLKKPYTLEKLGLCVRAALDQPRPPTP